MLKRLIAALLLFIILLSALAPVLAAADHETNGEILQELGVLTGYEDGKLHLDDNFTRQDMVVMISRLYKEENKAKSYVGRNVFKDLNASRKFYIPYITWAKDQGLIQGQEADVFGFNANTTVQEFQTILLRALGYGEEAQNWNQVPDLAKSLGIMNNLNLSPSSKLTRGQMASMVLNTLGETKKASLLTLAEVIGLEIPDIFKVDEKLTINKSTITIEGKVSASDTLKLHIRPTSSGISGGAKLIDLTIDKNGSFSEEIKNLQAGKYEYRFEGSSKNTVFKAFEIEEVEFALVDIIADNLKEIHLTFTQPVDTAAASFISNYTTNAGTINDVRFGDNNTKVILVLNGTMRQDNRYKIDAIAKAIDGQDLIIEGEEFTASDKMNPSALEAVQLGDKGLKLVFSEPIKGARANNFKIDDRTFTGNVNTVNHEVFLTFRSSYDYLREGSHTIDITGITDFANRQMSNDYLDFEIINDKTAPKIIGAAATLEEVIIEFDEDIDPSTASRNQFYIMQRNRKANPDSVNFKGNKAYLSFKNNKLSLNETTIYVENVTDYSGNRMKLDEIDVLPVIDETPPRVTNYVVSEDGRSITVYYSKNVNGKDRPDYLIEDQNGRELNIREIQGSDKEFIIYLSSVLPIGKNTLHIDGVEDTTPHRNLVVPYSVTIDMKDITRPDIISYSGFENFIMVQFDKEMDYTTVENPENYIINFNNSINFLPHDSYISLSEDGKTLTIELPKTISGRDVEVGRNLTSIEIRGIKDTSGNDIKDLIKKLEFDRTSTGNAKPIDYYTNVPGKQGALLDENTIKVRFNIPIVEADERDFVTKNRDIIIDEVVADGSNVVTIYLRDNDNTSIEKGDLSIAPRNGMLTSIGTSVDAVSLDLVDEVAPRVKYRTSTLVTRADTIELPFTEDLESRGEGLYARDLEIYKENGWVLLRPDVDYTTKLHSTDKSIIIITLKDRDTRSDYSVRVAGQNNTTPSNIRDLQGNFALDSIDSYRTDY
ncbi:MAG: Ig-like domain-containing protein [Tissierella sp.]|nr:Ig-like domain-containing protein [Tissierella sp.]